MATDQTEYQKVQKSLKLANRKAFSTSRFRNTGPGPIHIPPVERPVTMSVDAIQNIHNTHVL